jgi:hypothetical protein
MFDNIGLKTFDARIGILTTRVQSGRAIGLAPRSRRSKVAALKRVVESRFALGAQNGPPTSQRGNVDGDDDDWRSDAACRSTESLGDAQ